MEKWLPRRQRLWDTATRSWCLPFLILICFLPGCATERGFGSSQPALSLPQETLGERSENASEEIRAPIEGPLTVERAIDEALAASTELEQIGQRIEAATEQVRQARSPFYPRLLFSEEFNTTDNPVFSLMHIINQRRLQPTVNFNDPGRQQNFGTRIQGEWLLFEGGSRWYDGKAALDGRRSVEAELPAARNQLVAKVTETYYRWLQVIDFRKVAEQALESAKTDESLGEARLKVEAALPGEIMRLKVRTAEARNNLVVARTAARRLQAGLERLLARSIRTEEIPEPTPAPSFPEQEAMVRDPQTLIREALEKRPEMAAVRSLIEAARNRVRSARGGFLPKLGTSAQYQLDSEDLGESADSWMLAVQATWPLFEGGITLSRVREAQARLKETEARGEQLALDIALEVNQAVLAVMEAAERIHVAEERRLWAEKALKEVRHLYRSQVVTVDALLQAQVAWSEAEISYTGAVFEGKVARALLKRSLGDFADTIN